MSVEKVGEVSGIQPISIREIPNISRARLGSGYGLSAAPKKMIAASVRSVLNTYANHIGKLVSSADRSQVHMDAEKLKISPSAYLVMLAGEHERSQEHPSPDINVVMIRFIVHLMKIRGEHSDLIHDCQEIRENLNHYENVPIILPQNDLERSVVKNRLKSIFG